jgi:hypothetical protein
LSQISLANKPECEVNYILGVTRMKESANPLFANIQKWSNPSFWFLYRKTGFDRSIRKVISDSYELIEVASPKIIPDAKIANLLKEKKVFIKNKLMVVKYGSTSFISLF